MDLTKCVGGNCPLKNNCKRYLATAGEYQSYFVELPFQKVDDKVTCTFYYEVKDLDLDASNSSKSA